MEPQRQIGLVRLVLRGLILAVPIKAIVQHGALVRLANIFLLRVHLLQTRAVPTVRRILISPVEAAAIQTSFFYLLILIQLNLVLPM